MKVRVPIPLLACAALTIVTGQALPQASADSLDLVLPDGKERLRIEVRVPGETAGAKWRAFLDRWFDYFDTDGDGTLQQREAARVLPVPLPANKSVPFDFNKADTNTDAKITREEWRSFYDRAGFTPVLAVVEPVAPQDAQVADALFRHLGPDAGGKLTLDRFKRAPELLRKLDENEDEVLTPAEILSLGLGDAPKAATRSGFAWSRLGDQQPGSRISLTLVAADSPVLRVDATGQALQAIATSSSDIVSRIRHKQTLLAFAVSSAMPAKAAATSRHFVIAQFKNVAGASTAIEKRQTDNDASLQLLADIFPHANRNQDGKLTLVEVDQFLGLIEQGVTCPILLTVTDHGRNLFPHLDTNADGRLDRLELSAAWRGIAAVGGDKGWTRAEVPHCIQVRVQSGFTPAAFGPVPLAAPVATSKPLAVKRPVQGPAWFAAMDKNGDGLISPREFLGPLELFRRLDHNGDGVISSEEALRPMPPG